MAIWFTSDCHFNHANIIAYEKESRPFDNIEDMNEVIVENWNKVVSNEDTIYILGDLCMGDISTVDKYIPRLHGNKILVRGNHDTDKRIAAYQKYQIEVVDFKTLEYKDIMFCMSHYPIWNDKLIELITRHGERKMIWCYGHIHSQAPIGLHDGMYHVGVDTNNLTPVNIETIVAEYKK